MADLLIYTERTNNRVAYTFDLMVCDLLGLSYEFTHDKEAFNAYKGAKFSYAQEPCGEELFFRSYKLLFETEIKHQPFTFCEHGRIKGFFSVLEPSAIPFDIFASAFFMVSRYYEYLPSKYDKYGRFRASQSMILKAGFLEKPMVNYYALELKSLLAERYPHLPFKQSKFQYIPTFDIDIAYSYLHKGLKRTVGAFMRSVLLSNFKDIRDRIAVLAGKKQDPYDTYDYIFNVCETNGFRPRFFFLLGDGSRFDKNISVEAEKYRELIKNIAERADIGIHLSFKSHVSSAVTKREIDRLKRITGQAVTANRYHYLRFLVPNSYSMLLKNGITEDYSMGYAPHPGFRAGICTPHYFYNVKLETVTPLKIYPITFMDASFSHYRRYNPKQSLEKMRVILKHVKEVGGTAYTLWHNSSFTEEGEWKGWRKIFETISSEAAEAVKQTAEVES
ncbi:MAG: polysaccharide deacetylase family protein [Chitinophagales bacterium]